MMLYPKQKPGFKYGFNLWKACFLRLFFDMEWHLPATTWGFSLAYLPSAIWHSLWSVCCGVTTKQLAKGILPLTVWKGCVFWCVSSSCEKPRVLSFPVWHQNFLCSGCSGCNKSSCVVFVLFAKNIWFDSKQGHF